MVADFARMRLFQSVRRFAEATRDWEPAIRYMTLPDERANLPLVAYRVYGSFTETLAIQAAAGLDSPELVMSERMLVLPTAERLAAMKKAAGYELDPSPATDDPAPYTATAAVTYEAAPPIVIAS